MFGGRGRRIATTSLRTGLAMTGVLHGCGTKSAGGQGRPPLRVGCKGCGKRGVGDAAPYGGSWGENGCEKARGALGSPGRVERGSYKGE